MRNQNTIFNRKMPTLLGIGILLIGILITSLFVETGVLFIGQASPSQNPKDIHMSNITDTSFTVSYRTDSATVGAISLGKEKTSAKTYFDDRSQQKEKITPYRLHVITIQNLQPLTAYYFSIVSDSEMYENNGTPFEVKTGQTLQRTSSQQLIKGNVITPDGSNISEAIVYVKSTNSQTLSTLVEANGSFTLDASIFRTLDNSSYITLTSDQILQMEIISPTMTSNITLLLQQADHIPPIIFSNNYDFTININPLQSTNVTSSVTTRFPVLIANQVGNNTAQIVFPKDKEGLTDQKPIFKGTASPGASVKVVIHSNQEIQTEVQADENGIWSYRPSDQLPPGQHSISITTQDPSGVVKTITQSFVVYAAGTQISQTATPSASPVIATPTPVVIFISATPTPNQPPGDPIITSIGFIGILTTISGILLLLFNGKIFIP